MRHVNIDAQSEPSKLPVVQGSSASEAKKRRLGVLPDEATVEPDFDEMPAELVAAFEGD